MCVLRGPEPLLRSILLSIGERNEAIHRFRVIGCGVAFFGTGPDKHSSFNYKAEDCRQTAKHCHAVAGAPTGPGGAATADWTTTDSDQAIERPGSEPRSADSAAAAKIRPESSLGFHGRK